MMAREMAVDIASHSPQVDPILDELSAVLAEVAPMPPKIPFYSSTLFDPRDRPVFDAGYWVGQFASHRAVLRGGAGSGWRTGTGYSSNWHHTHCSPGRRADRCQGLDIPVAAWPACGASNRCRTGCGLAGGSAQLRVPRWTSRCCIPVGGWWMRRCRRGRIVACSSTPGRPGIRARRIPFRCHPLLGAHVRLLEEPERHAWHSEVGTAAMPWLDDHRVHNVAALPGAAYCEMALAAARTVLGEGSEVRDIRFEQMLLLADETPVILPGIGDIARRLDFVVETDQEGERVQRAAAVLHAEDGQDRPPPHDIAALLTARSFELDWTELEQWFDDHGVQIGPAFAGVAAAARCRQARSATMLAEVALPGSIRSQQSDYGIHPALLDACIQSVMLTPPSRAAAAVCCCHWARKPLRAYAPARSARYCYTTGNQSRRAPGSKPISTYSTSTAWCCWPCEGCKWEPGSPEPQSAIAC